MTRLHSLANAYLKCMINGFIIPAIKLETLSKADVRPTVRLSFPCPQLKHHALTCTFFVTIEH